MDSKNLFFESLNIKISKSEDYVEIKFPTQYFTNEQADCLTFEKFTTSEASKERIQEDCDDFLKICNGADDDDAVSQYNSIDEKRFMREFIEKNDAFSELGEAIQINSKVMQVLKEVDSFKELEECMKPSLLMFLGLKYDRPQFYGALITDAKLRRCLKDWNIDIYENNDIDFFTLYHIKKEEIDSVEDCRDFVAASTPISTLTRVKRVFNNEHQQTEAKKPCYHNHACFVDETTFKLALLLMQQMTGNFADGMKRNVQELTASKLRSKSLEKLVLELKTKIMDMEVERDVALTEVAAKKSGDSDGARDCIACLRKKVSAEATLKREIISLRETVRQLQNNLHQGDEDKRELQLKVESYEGQMHALKKCLLGKTGGN